MGSEQSSSETSAELSTFTHVEQKRLKKLFVDLSCGSKGLKLESLQTQLGSIFSADLIGRLYSVMCYYNSAKIGNAEECVTAQGFYTTVSYVFHGSVEEQAEFLCLLVSIKHGNVVNIKDLHCVIKGIVQGYFKSNLVYNAENTRSWHLDTPSDEELSRLSLYILSDLLYPDAKKKAQADRTKVSDAEFVKDDVIRWLRHTSLVISCLRYVLHHTFPVIDQMENSFIPSCQGLPPGADKLRFLSLASVLAINYSLPASSRDKWTLLFDSRQHGESYTNMMRNLKKKHNTVLIVRDSDGHMFGGFSTAIWSNHPAFQGSTNCFLFSLSPVLDIYKPSGLNTNFFYLNSGQETLPNGMGMGGQLDYFGLWLSVEYGEGHSMAKPLSTTYSSPMLSKEPHFKYEDLQVWQVTGRLEEELMEAEGVTGKSILDCDPAAKAILEMIGKGNLSDGIRESDIQASSPGEHALPDCSNPEQHPKRPS